MNAISPKSWPVSEVIVVNASPLIFLGNAGRIDLLLALGASRVLVPDTVFDEVTKSRHADRAAATVRGADWLERTAAPQVPAAVIEWDLGVGESCVIATALTLPGSRTVIDDLLGRKCALSLGIDVIGTLGVVIAAHRRGVVDDPRRVLLDLRAAGMWLSDEVIARALRIAGDEKK